MLVHICCAPDALYVMNLLKEEYQLCGLFYNPNIHPWREYHKRLEEARKVAKILGFVLREEEYDVERWRILTQKFEKEPERGKRCDICYALRLEKTAKITSEMGLDIFTTTMTLSPLKKEKTLNRIGKMFARRYGVDFLEADFKKKDGFKKSVLLSKEYKLYRQNYCGCIWSIRK